MLCSALYTNSCHAHTLASSYNKCGKYYDAAEINCINRKPHFLCSREWSNIPEFVWRKTSGKENKYMTRGCNKMEMTYLNATKNIE